ncbi:PepSY domain-containing protein [Bacillus sp. JJ634]
MYENYYHSNPTSMYRQRITKQQAQAIALQRVPGRVLHVDMDLENGVLVYEVFIMTSQGRIFEVEILAKTGKILKIEQENDDDFDNPHNPHNPHNHNNHNNHNDYNNND